MNVATALGLVLGSTVLAAACAQDTVCAGVGLVRVQPVDTTIAPGASFIAHYDEGGTCDPVGRSDARYYPVAVAWQSSDSLIALVDSVTGTVTARRPGDARITARDGGIVIQVHVR